MQYNTGTGNRNNDLAKTRPASSYCRRQGGRQKRCKKEDEPEPQKLVGLGRPDVRRQGGRQKRCKKEDEPEPQKLVGLGRPDVNGHESDRREIETPSSSGVRNCFRFKGSFTNS
ncbi:hypothetical protein QE152_g15202 [Popillia japonica]|uniref:Uncharacterized protein n=1 Tax=Popillia japonica TaxID=7064 RepID=A0AAW1L6D5_POPJA